MVADANRGSEDKENEKPILLVIKQLNRMLLMHKPIECFNFEEFLSNAAVVLLKIPRDGLHQ